jgi:crotonobetainyl-CoA:carnitine CoA-transferase CaiB-like acyl-CoA transferase
MSDELTAMSYLDGLRVLELADEAGEYAGKMLAGLGADVVKVEPPEGEATRQIGPFYQDKRDPESSLHFWHYNLGKRSVCLDLDSDAGLAQYRALAAQADVIIETRPAGYLEQRGLGYPAITASNPSLIQLRISPFGDDGPWSGFIGSDLVHLALGGVMMNCGYDPDPSGFYDTPPVAPQMWHTAHIVGEMAVMSVLGALHHRIKTGVGQQLSINIHTAVSMNTETDIPDWVFLRQAHYRLTCRHSRAVPDGASISITKDGRYLLPYRTYLKHGPSQFLGTREVLRAYGMAGDLDDPQYDDPAVANSIETRQRINLLVDELVKRCLYSADVWRAGQRAGQPWAPIRRPEENIDDPHWRARGAFFEVEHPELNRSFTYTGPKWYSAEVNWRQGNCAPLLGEHNGVIEADWSTEPIRRPVLRPRASEEPARSVYDKPFALSDVRVIDLGWMLASAGAGRFLAAMGADVIKVEHFSRPDAMRHGAGMAPFGGRAERDAATAPIPPPETDNLNRAGVFAEINAGKLGLSLNLKSVEAKRILEDLIRDADVVIEGFSPGTMERMGFGYERLKELNPSIIYVQQSGFGERGTLGQAKAFGPTAQAYSGISEMSGLPEPFPPAGIGYSFLDWFGAYNVAVAMLAALARRDFTGDGCHIDAAQAEVGLYLVGTAVLDWSANGRRWRRYGNRSPYKLAAPHGAYRCAGDDRWIAISAFTDEQWTSLARVLGSPEWTTRPEFATLAGRVAAQDELDELLDAETQSREPFELMYALQDARVSAGVCQTAQDRYENDPQLRHDNWMVELAQTEIGTWPIKDHPVSFSETPAYVGGQVNRAGPNYGEDTDRILSDLLGLSQERIDELRESGAI